MLIRPVREEDLPQLMEIMNYYRKNSSYIWDRTLLDLARAKAWLSEHIAPPYCALVGYASLSRFRPHSGYDKTAEDSIYVKPGFESRGIGGALMRALFEAAEKSGLYTLTAWIDSENVLSVKFHERCGFVIVGTFRNAGVLDGKKRSVVIMSRDI
jgi:L-amino acid N-acyltransferase YncA